MWKQLAGFVRTTGLPTKETSQTPLQVLGFANKPVTMEPSIPPQFTYEGSDSSHDIFEDATDPEPTVQANDEPPTLPTEGGTNS